MNRRWLTQDVPGIDLVARASHEDFVVDEVPLFAPKGEGTHVYVDIEKRGVTTAEAVRGIARRLGRDARDIGVAGQKDARAVTRQRISIEHLPESEWPKIDDAPRVRALSFARHDRKLKMAFLEGNRFTLRLRAPEVPGASAARPSEGAAVEPQRFRPVTDDELERARAVVARLAAEGLPNWFGEQRFGGRGSTHLLGRALLREDPVELLSLLCGRPGPGEAPRVQEARARYDAGDAAGALALFPKSYDAERRALRAIVEKGADPARAAQAISKDDRRFYVNAAQSAVFNALLEARMAAGALASLEEGDVATIHESGGSFVVTDAAREAPRVRALEISPAGPLWGAKLLMAAGAVREREVAALRAFGLEPAHLEGPDAKTSPGARRVYRTPVTEASVAREEDGALLVRLFLPAGSYATAVIAEIVKPAGLAATSS